MDNKIHEDQKNQLPLLKSWEQKQGVRRNSRVLHLPPAYNTTKEVSKPPKTPLWSNLWQPPTLTPYKEPTCPQLGEEQGNLLFVLIPHCCSRGHNKALPEFLVWPLISFYRLRIPRTLMGNTLKLCQTFVIFLRARGFATKTCCPGHW